MKATRFEFRYRLTIGFFIYLLGFWAPWIHYGPFAGRSSSTWLELCGLLASTHVLSLQYATIIVTLLAILFAAVGAAFRVSGAAYLGAGIVTSGAMHARSVVAAGPYRHVRNPLYLGSFVFSLAISILMPPTGAIFSSPQFSCRCCVSFSEKKSALLSSRESLIWLTKHACRDSFPVLSPASRHPQRSRDGSRLSLPRLTRSV